MQMGRVKNRTLPSSQHRSIQSFNNCLPGNISSSFHQRKDGGDRILWTRVPTARQSDHRPQKCYPYLENLPVREEVQKRNPVSVWYRDRYFLKPAGFNLYQTGRRHASADCFKSSSISKVTFPRRARALDRTVRICRFHPQLILPELVE